MNDFPLANFNYKRHSYTDLLWAKSCQYSLKVQNIFNINTFYWQKSAGKLNNNGEGVEQKLAGKTFVSCKKFSLPSIPRFRTTSIILATLGICIAPSYTPFCFVEQWYDFLIFSSFTVSSFMSASFFSSEFITKKQIWSIFTNMKTLIRLEQYLLGGFNNETGAIRKESEQSRGRIWDAPSIVISFSLITIFYHLA